MQPHKEQETFFLWLSQLFGTRRGNQSRVKAGWRVEEEEAAAMAAAQRVGTRGCMVDNFKGEHRVHTDMRLRQQARAHIDFTKRS